MAIVHLLGRTPTNPPEAAAQLEQPISTAEALGLSDRDLLLIEATELYNEARRIGAHGLRCRAALLMQELST